MKRNWKVFVISHSHTDIGYTERQEKLCRYHVDFIIQAIDILNGIHSGKIKDAEGFRWQVENYWQIRNFYENAPEEYIKQFEDYVRTGEIGLSGNYLNMTELVDADTMDWGLSEMREYADKHGFPMRSGMSADINGYAWGYSDLLRKHGVENLYCALHPHHGMFPVFRKHQPFYWQGPSGKSILVWGGEHYHFGNELILAPYGGSSYMDMDEYNPYFQSRLILNKNREDTDRTEMEILRTRLERYLDNFENEGYEYDFVPALVSGASTDNGFPSEGIAQRINELNRIYDGKVVFEMATLDMFFDYVKKNCHDIPVYSGDWNDWWADGVGSTPTAVKSCRAAQRRLALAKKLDPEGKASDKNLIDQARYGVMMYSEHTWGYSSSVIEPWDTLVGDLDNRKSAYAVNADTAAARNLDGILASMGEVTIRYQRPQHYGIVNPHNTAGKMKASLYIELWEFVEGVRFSIDTPIEVYDLTTGEIIPHQVTKIARAYQVDVVLDMPAKGRRNLGIRLAERKPYRMISFPYIGADKVADVVLPDEYERNTEIVETDFFRIRFSQKDGIVSIYDKKHGKEILQKSEYPAFSGIYEVTPSNGNPVETRRLMGRNRKSEATRRYASVQRNIRVVDDGDVFTAVQIDYELHGTQMYSVLLKVYKAMPQIDTMVRVHKDSTWDPENLYISLPFTAGEGEELYVDKTGCLIRPGVDQLPGTNREFYLIQNGFAWKSGTGSVVLSTRDIPLMVMNTLESHPIRLSGEPDWEFNRSSAFSWAMNNFWETNFRVDLSGFYEFAYSLRTSDSSDPEELIGEAEAMNEGSVSFYI